LQRDSGPNTCLTLLGLTCQCSREQLYTRKIVKLNDSIYARISARLTITMSRVAHRTVYKLAGALVKRHALTQVRRASSSSICCDERPTVMRGELYLGQGFPSKYPGSKTIHIARRSIKPIAADSNERSSKIMLIRSPIKTKCARTPQICARAQYCTCCYD
jgi:hypothetical protein